MKRTHDGDTLGSRVLVAGATGLTGRRVVERLLDAGTPVRALCRDPKAASAVLGSSDGLEIQRGDVRDAESLAGVGVGIDVAIIATGTRSYFGRNGGARVDAQGTTNLVRALVRDGVRRVVLLGAFGLERRSPWLTLFSLVLNRYFHWKALGERAVRESGLEYFIVRPVELGERAPRAHALLNQSAELSLLRRVSRDLVADVLVRCARFAGECNKTFELCEGDVTLSIDAQLERLAPDVSRPVPPRTPLFTRREPLSSALRR